MYDGLVKKNDAHVAATPQALPGPGRRRTEKEAVERADALRSFAVTGKDSLHAMRELRR